MTRPSFDSRHEGDAGDAWLDAMLRAAHSPEIGDAGFCTSVLTRVAAHPVVLAPMVALAAVRHAEGRERANMRWTIVGTLVGALVALLAGSRGATGAVDPTGILWPVVAMVLASTVLAWLAISRT